MHILHVISSYGPSYVGNEIHGELAQAIIARGHRYSILTLARRDAPYGVHVWDDNGIKVYELGQGPGIGARAVGTLSTHIFHYQPFLFALGLYHTVFTAHLYHVDVVLVEGGYPLGAIAALWQPFFGYPLALVLHGGDMHREDAANYGYGRYAVARWLLRYTMQRATLMRTYSPLARDAAIERGADPSRIAVVAQNIGDVCYLPTGTEWVEFRATARRAVSARHALQGPYLLVALGRLLPIKGFDGLIRLLPDIQDMAGARVELVLCGPSRSVAGVGDYRAYLEQLAKDMGVHSNVIFTNELPHAAVREYLAAADLLVVPSVMEGGAKVVMEAAAVGTPFVATETAGTPAHLPAGGFTVPPLRESQTAFVRATAVLLRNADLRQRLSAHTLEQSKRFRAEERAKELLPIYEAAVRDL